MYTIFPNLFLVTCLLFCSLLPSQIYAQMGTFKNPVLNEGPDPWVYKHTDGMYYMMVTRGNRLDIWKSPTLSGVAKNNPVTVWTKPDVGPNSQDIWAPEIHHLQGKWYIYYTATDAKNPGDNTRYVFVLENSASDPLQGTWVDKGKVNTKYPGLDGSVFEHGGKIYFMYSAYVGPQSVLCIAPMQNPWTLSAQEEIIAKPTYAWEKHREREILEGPQLLKGKNGKLFIIYSASACWDDNYSLGMLTAHANSDLLKAGSWQKSPTPVFSKSDENSVFGPGHNSFTTSPDGTEDWIVYHGKDVANGECKGRNTRIQKFTWHPDGTPNFGIPASNQTSLPVPAGEQNTKSSGSTFTNPLLPGGPDPWSFYKDGYYYYTSTGPNRVTLWKTRAITDLKNAESKIAWRSPATGFTSRETWAPEIHFLKGKWYIYFAADDGNNTNHRMYVLENAATDPLSGSWIEKGQIRDSTDRWAIDGSVFEHNGNLYMLWSGWEGFSNGQQNIYIAPMSNPWTISGPRVLLSSPNFPWETIGKVDGTPILVNEGPQILKGKDKLFIIYSASGCWTDEYKLGMLSIPFNSNLLDQKSWQKSTTPVFISSPQDSVFAPGHNSFFKSPDGTEDWILYHANSKPGQGCGGYRSPRAQKISWKANGTPDFGTPVSTKTPLARPSGEKDNTFKFYPVVKDASVQATIPHMNIDRQLSVKNKEHQTYLQFHLNDIQPERIKSVRLRLREGNTPAGNTTFEIKQVSGEWKEDEVNWKTKPKPGNMTYGNFNGKLSEGEMIDVELTNFPLKESGTYDLILVPTGGNTATQFYASEEGDGPQLVIEYK